LKRSTKLKILSTTTLGMLLIGYNQCVAPMAASKKNNLKFSSSASTNGSSGVSRAVSLDAFSKTVYPVTRAHCVNCHGASQSPLHASANMDTAFDALINSAKVDFTNPSNSRIVLKLRNEQHNCWGTCSANADEMLAQVTNWKNLIANTSADATTNVSGKTTKETMTINQALNADDNGTVTLMAESSSVKAPMVAAQENGTSYVWVPATVAAKDLNSTDAGTATLNFQVPASDFYKVFMYVNAPSATSDSLYTKISGSDYKEWTIGMTNGYEWREVKNTPQNLDTEFYLTGSKSYQIELRQKESGVKVSKVVVTSDYAFDPSVMPQVSQKATLTVALADISGVTDSWLDIDVENYDQYSYKISNPRIRTTKDMLVKKMKVLMNGSFNPQHSTYLVVNKTVTKADPQLSTFSMIMLKDKGADYDKLSFSFDVIEAVK
jgi:hypothetical protein